MVGLAAGRLSKAICDRCCMKFDYLQLSADPNYKSLRVCCDCKDKLDPYKLPPIPADAIALKYPRPDTPLVPGDE